MPKIGNGKTQEAGETNDPGAPGMEQKAAPHVEMKSLLIYPLGYSIHLHASISRYTSGYNAITDAIPFT